MALKIIIILNAFGASMSTQNNSAEKCYLSTYDIRIIQNDKQIEQDDSSSSRYNGGYEELSYDVLSWATTSEGFDKKFLKI